jgi:hypothetical protein
MPATHSDASRTWSIQRQRGLLYHLAVRWLLRYGAPCFALNYANRRWGGHMEMNASWWLWNLSIFAAVCIFCGVLQWIWMEHLLRKSS